MKNNSGFSMIELMVTIAIAVGGFYFAGDNIMRVKELGKMARNNFVISELEEKIRLSISQRSQFQAITQKNKFVSKCLQFDSEPCPTDSQNLEVWHNSNKKMATRYYLDGRVCKGKKDCPIELDVRFRGICASGDKCDQVANAKIEYSIRVEGVQVAGGSINKPVVATKGTDNNEVCEQKGDEDSIMLVSDVRLGKLNCVEAPKLNRRLEGAKPKKCKTGEELLVAVTDEGETICEKIKFKGKVRERDEE